MGGSVSLLFALAGAFILIISQRYGSALRKLPGPFVASLTDVWRYLIVRRNTMPQTSLALHQKHGPLVRIGPKYVSASSPEAIQAIYRAGTGYAKTQVYGLLQPQLDGSDLHNLFSTQDKTFHSTLKRNLGALYSSKAVEGRETNIEAAIQLLVKQLNGGAAATGSTVIDLSAWMHYWAFEAMSQVNFSRTFGFLESGEDVDNICSMSHENMRYFGLMGQLPWFERLYRNSMSLVKKSGVDPLFTWVMGLIEERKAMPKQSKDVLDQFLALHEEKPKSFTERDVVASTYISVVTAHDVLAITLRSLVYYLVKNPRVLHNFKAEISSFEQADKLSPNVKFAETQDMEYVNAVIMETLRIHPSTGLIFERYVPPGGVELHGKFIPEGTTIGVNSWVFNRDKATFGEDSEVYRPERWIDSSPEQLKEMKKWMFTFSAGARACIGRHLATVEMTKLVVDIFRNFDFELIDPDHEWTFDGNWLTTQSPVEMRVIPVSKKHAAI